MQPSKNIIQLPTPGLIACDMSTDCKSGGNPELIRCPVLLIAIKQHSSKRNGFGKRVPPQNGKVRMDTGLRVCEACRKFYGTAYITRELIEGVFRDEARRKKWEVVRNKAGNEEFVLLWEDAVKHPPMPAPPPDMEVEVTFPGQPGYKAPPLRIHEKAHVGSAAADKAEKARAEKKGAPTDEQITDAMHQAQYDARNRNK